MECGNCTMCCILPEIKETDSKAGSYCKYCVPNSSEGCKIYENRPESCKIFLCAWRQMENAHIDLRPDNCGFLFEKWSDHVIVGGTIDGINVLVMDQIDHFRSEGISVLLVNHKEKTRTYYLAENHDIDFVRKELENSVKYKGV